MTTQVDALYATDSAGNLSAYDLRIGSNLMNYKTENNAISARSLNVLQDYIIAGDKGPIIRTWARDSPEKLQIRMVVPGAVGCCAVSPDELFIAVSTGLKMLVWQLSTGKLLSTTTCHYQPISVLRWSPDGTYIISGGEDGLVCVWKSSEIVSSNQVYVGVGLKADMTTQLVPRFTFSHHSVAVTDLYVGFGGLRSRLFTTSKDNTLKIYDLAAGDLLVSLVCETKPMAVLVDACEKLAFLGMFDGRVNAFSLQEPPRSLEVHLEETKTNFVLRGHTKSVNCLALSIDDTILASGSADETINLWSVPSNQLLRTIRMKGSVQNLVVRLLLSDPFGLSGTVITNFEKQYDIRDVGETLEMNREDDLYERNEAKMNKEDRTDEMRDMMRKIEHLESVNQELFNFSTKVVMKRVSKTNVSRRAKKEGK